MSVFVAFEWQTQHALVALAFRSAHGSFSYFLPGVIAPLFRFSVIAPHAAEELLDWGFAAEDGPSAITVPLALQNQQFGALTLLVRAQANMLRLSDRQSRSQILLGIDFLAKFHKTTLLFHYDEPSRAELRLE